MPSAVANCTGTIAAIRSSVKRTAGQNCWSFSIAWKLASVQASFARNARPNDWTIGHARKNSR
jgi:hypothetical protein